MSKLQKNRSKNSSVIETRLTGRSAVFCGPRSGLPALDRGVVLVTVADVVSTVARAPDSFTPVWPRVATFYCKRVVRGSRITLKPAFMGRQLMKAVCLTRANRVIVSKE